MADPIKRYEKSVIGELDYIFDWSEWLSEFENIIATTWTLKGGDGLLSIDAEEFDATSSTVWVSGGTSGQTYTLECSVTTDSAPNDRVPARSFLLTVLEDNFYREAAL